MKYEIGDKVRIKSLDWYNENKDEDGYVDGGRFFFDKEMTKFCGKVLKIVSVLKESYYMDDGYCNIDWTDEMIEELVEEETKPKFKVGDKVRIKSLGWYNENKGNDGIVEFSTSVFVPGMSQFCGKVVTIEAVYDEGDDDVIYCMEEIGYDWTEEMFDGLVEEEMSLNIDDFQDDNEILDIIDEYVHRLKGNECQIILPDGYIFKDGNGNEILTSKIILEKKKKEYPKTYEECCEIIHSDPKFYVDTHLYSGTLETLYKLLIYRDAYWKLYGEEMGLGKPWEPDYVSENCGVKYCIGTASNEIIKCTVYTDNSILSFPTEEMRDAFYENFKEEIEICKEFL